ncbi:MAG: hypothetical protein SNF33_02180 [Candidatus Algichlamydia australiensis]|nr:hypothetical protein [Chlamydiales bacterium]
MATSIHSTHFNEQERLQREPKKINVEALIEFRRINELFIKELKTEKIPESHELKHYHRLLITNTSNLHFEGETFEKAKALIQALPEWALDCPRKIDLNNLGVLLQDFRKSLDEQEMVVADAFGNFGSLIGLAAMKPQNLRKSLVDLSRSADKSTKKTMADCQEKITKIEGRVQTLHRFLEKVRTDGDNGKTFSIDEISNEWAELRQLLKEIPDDAAPYVRKQVEELSSLMDEFDFTKDASKETCKKFESACKRLLEGSQKELPNVTRTLELSIQLSKIMHEALVFCAKRNQELARVLTNNQK